MYNRVCFGDRSFQNISDIKSREIFIFLILLLLIIGLGIYPNFLISLYELSSNKLVIL